MTTPSRRNRKALVVARAPEPKSTAAGAWSSRLPGERGVRPDLIESAVREINQVYVSKGLETAKWIGQYVLQRFFDGEPENFRRRGRKHVSFRKLCEREDLAVSHGFLWRSVALVDQLKALPGEIADALPVSHHTLLLPVHDEKTKVLLARKAVRESLSKRQLEVEVRRTRRPRPNGPRLGRPPLPPSARFVTALGRLARAARAEGIGSANELAGLSADKRAGLLADAERHLTAIKLVVERIRRQATGAVESRGSAVA